jgi:hypothetical protein
MTKINHANELIKSALSLSLIIALGVLNSFLFDFLFNPDYAYTITSFYHAWFVLTLIAVEVMAYRILTKKLKVKLVFGS